MPQELPEDFLELMDDLTKAGISTEAGGGSTEAG
jgi:hypothetical protein